MSLAAAAAIVTIVLPGRSSKPAHDATALRPAPAAIQEQSSVYPPSYKVFVAAGRLRGGNVPVVVDPRPEQPIQLQAEVRSQHSRWSARIFYGNEPIWQAHGLVPQIEDPVQFITIMLPKQFLAPGNYTLDWQPDDETPVNLSIPYSRPLSVPGIGKATKVK